MTVMGDALEWFGNKPVNPSGAETKIFLADFVNSMAVDALVLCTVRSSTTMEVSMQDKQGKILTTCVISALRND